MSVIVASAGAFLTVVMVVMVMLVIVTAALLVVVVVMVMLVVVTAALLVVVMVVMVMLVIVTAAFLVVIVVVMMVLVVVTAALLVVIVVVMVMLVVVTAALLIVIVMMVMMMTALGADLLCAERFKLSCKSRRLFHSGKDLGTCKLAPVCGNDLRTFVVLSDKLAGGSKLFLGETLSVAEDYSICAFYLIIEEFAEVLHIHLAFLCINYCSCRVESDIVKLKVVYSLDNVGKLAHARGLDDDSFR